MIEFQAKAFESQTEVVANEILTTDIDNISLNKSIHPSHNHGIRKAVKQTRIHF